MDHWTGPLACLTKKRHLNNHGILNALSPNPSQSVCARGYYTNWRMVLVIFITAGQIDRHSQQACEGHLSGVCVLSCDVLSGLAVRVTRLTCSSHTLWCQKGRWYTGVRWCHGAESGRRPPVSLPKDGNAPPARPHLFEDLLSAQSTTTDNRPTDIKTMEGHGVSRSQPVHWTPGKLLKGAVGWLKHFIGRICYLFFSWGALSCLFVNCFSTETVDILDTPLEKLRGTDLRILVSEDSTAENLVLFRRHSGQSPGDEKWRLWCAVSMCYYVVCRGEHILGLASVHFRFKRTTLQCLLCYRAYSLEDS